MRLPHPHLLHLQPIPPACLPAHGPSAPAAAPASKPAPAPAAATRPWASRSNLIPPPIDPSLLPSLHPSILLPRPSIPIPPSLPPPSFLHPPASCLPYLPYLAHSASTTHLISNTTTTKLPPPYSCARPLLAKAPSSIAVESTQSIQSSCAFSLARALSLASCPRHSLRHRIVPHRTATHRAATGSTPVSQPLCVCAPTPLSYPRLLSPPRATQARAAPPSSSPAARVSLLYGCDRCRRRARRLCPRFSLSGKSALDASLLIIFPSPLSSSLARKPSLSLSRSVFSPLMRYSSPAPSPLSCCTRTPPLLFRLTVRPSWRCRRAVAPACFVWAFCVVGSLTRLGSAITPLRHTLTIPLRKPTTCTIKPAAHPPLP